MTGKAAALAAALLLFGLQKTAACLGDFASTYTILEKLPTTASEQEVVARVEILDVVQWTNARPSTLRPERPPAPPRAKKVRVRVSEAIKGTRVGDEFVVSVYYSSCDVGFSADKDKSIWRPYIAGRFQTLRDGDFVFRGAWKSLAGELIFDNH